MIGNKLLKPQIVQQEEKRGKKGNYFQGERWEAQEDVFMARSQRSLFLSSASLFITQSRLKLKR